MQAQTVTRVLIWSRWLRLSHWSLAVSSLGLILTGWLMGQDSVHADIINDLHYLLSGLFLPALLLRLYLLFLGQGTDLLNDCEPNQLRMVQAWEVIRFYLTLGKLPLPKWYSHNPLWGPIYLMIFFFLLLTATSGLMLLNGIHFLSTISMLDLHMLCYVVILVFSLLHIVAVFTHDLSNKAGDISAMINGFRQFEVTESDAHQDQPAGSVSVETLIKTLKK